MSSHPDKALQLPPGVKPGNPRYGATLDRVGLIPPGHPILQSLLAKAGMVEK